MGRGYWGSSLNGTALSLKSVDNRVFRVILHSSIIKPLYGFVGNQSQHTSRGIPFLLIDYLERVDWTSRVLRNDKQGAALSTRSQLLYVLGIDDEIGCELASRFGEHYYGALGALGKLACYAEPTGKCWIARKNILHRSLH
jgi:hypothetical protein